MEMLTAPLRSMLDPGTGTLEPCDRFRQVRLSDMRGYFLSDAAAPEAPLDEDLLLYDVYELETPEQPGNMVPNSTVIHPGCVGDEYFMTKGHYHSNPGAAEIYYCVRGRGLLLMLLDGDCVTVEMTPGAVTYVPAGWAHRSVNTGDEALIIFAIYPADAGHDYGRIKELGFGVRVLRGDGGEPVILGQGGGR